MLRLQHTKTLLSRTSVTHNKTNVKTTPYAKMQNKNKVANSDKKLRVGKHNDSTEAHEELWDSQKVFIEVS